jgi:hypothetical protein
MSNSNNLKHLCIQHGERNSSKQKNEKLPYKYRKITMQQIILRDLIFLQKEQENPLKISCFQTGDKISIYGKDV